MLSDMKIDQDNEKKKLKVLPGYACSTCTIGPECGYFQEGYVCVYNDAFAAFPTRDADSVLALMGEIVETNKQRWRFAQIVEKISNNGLPMPDVTRLSEVVMRQAETLIELNTEVQSVTVKTEVVGRSAVQEAARGPSILQRLFSAPVLEARKENSDVIEMMNERAEDKRDEIAIRKMEATNPPGVGMGFTEKEEGSKGLGPSTFSEKSGEGSMGEKDKVDESLEKKDQVNP